MDATPTPGHALPQATTGKRHLKVATLASDSEERATEADTAVVRSIAPRLDERSREPSYEALGLTA
jgi:hypothetical protein